MDRKRVFILAMLLLPVVFAHAQKAINSSRSIHGVVLDRENGTPVEYALLRFSEGSNKHFTIKTETTPDGRFTILLKKNTQYLLEVSSVGYEQSSRSYHLGRNPNKTDTLFLKRTAADLEEVRITAKKQAFVVGLDKKVFNVEGNLMSKGGTALDAMRQVPTLSVGVDGSVKIRNGSPVILLDGKITSLTLDQIPADQIQSIEVMANPSAKFDAQGSSGIINIVLKKNRKPGFTGTVTGVWSTLRETYGYADLNMNTRCFGVSLHYMQHGHRNIGTEEVTRQDIAENRFIHQRTYTETTGPYHSLKAGLNFVMDKKNTFDLSADHSWGNHHTDATQFTDFMTADHSTDSATTRLNRYTNKFSFSHITLDYAHSFNKQDQKLSFNAALEKYNGPDDGTYSTAYLDKSGEPLREETLQQYDQLIRAHTFTVQTDFASPVINENTKMEVGLKLIAHHDHSSLLLDDFDPLLTQYVFNDRLSHNYQYWNNTYAAYATLSGKKGKFSYMGGLRFEQYVYEGNDLYAGSTFRFHNPGLYPSLFLTEKLDKGHELHLNYSRRVNRPDYGQMSPLTDYSSPLNLYRGNPDLQSEYTNLVEISDNYQSGKNNLITTVYLRNTNGLMTEYTVPLTNDTLLTTYVNASSSNTFGLEMIYRMPVAPWYDLMLSANVFYTSIQAGNLGTGLAASGFSGTGKVNSDFKLGKEVTAQLSFNYEAANILPQGKSLGFGTADVGFKKSVFKKKSGNITISLSDIANTLKQRLNTSSKDLFIQQTTYKPQSRVLKINFSYSFGKKIEKP